MSEYLSLREPFTNVVQDLRLIQHCHLAHILDLAYTCEIVGILLIDFVYLAVVRLDFKRFVRCGYYFGFEEWLPAFLALWILDPHKALLVFYHLA